MHVLFVTLKNVVCLQAVVGSYDEHARALTDQKHGQDVLLSNCEGGVSGAVTCLHVQSLWSHGVRTVQTTQLMMHVGHTSRPVCAVVVWYKHRLACVYLAWPSMFTFTEGQLAVLSTASVPNTLSSSGSMHTSCT